ncbi:hypothetical protein ISE1_3967 [plant metagenome]|uniref:Uncharacterized protein n=1 Tax=plant metagenome TaxID=1297885 RepID=A0A484P371_9ZZZZ
MFLPLFCVALDLLSRLGRARSRGWGGLGRLAPACPSDWCLSPASPYSALL